MGEKEILLIQHEMGGGMCINANTHRAWDSQGCCDEGSSAPSELLLLICLAPIIEIDRGMMHDLIDTATAGHLLDIILDPHSALHPGSTLLLAFEPVYL